MPAACTAAQCATHLQNGRPSVSGQPIRAHAAGPCPRAGALHLTDARNMPKRRMHKPLRGVHTVGQPCQRARQLCWESELEVLRQGCGARPAMPQTPTWTCTPLEHSFFRQGLQSHKVDTIKLPDLHWVPGRAGSPACHDGMHSLAVERSARVTCTHVHGCAMHAHAPRTCKHNQLFPLELSESLTGPLDPGPKQLG
jgi:hypothetical protein